MEQITHSRVEVKNALFSFYNIVALRLICNTFTYMFLLKKVLPALLMLLPGDALSQTHARIEPIRIEGRTMGTTYSIVYFGEKETDFKQSIDSLLNEVNSAINNYDSTSSVSSFNRSVAEFPIDSYHFDATLQKGLEVARASHGNFDPTVMPLVNLWGFGPLKNMEPSPGKIDSIKEFIGFDHIRLKGNRVYKNHPYVQLDFGGIGQGYGVDVISEFLKSKRIENFLVELGGEGFASGKNLKSDAPWKIGIIDPQSSKDEQQLLGYALVENGAFTTSGNYFNYRIIDGKKYGHTISPFTGFPIQMDLISVSIFTTDCTTADAWDTALMVAGKEKSIEFLKANPALAAILISLEDGKRTIFISDTIRDKVFLESTHDH
jgi:thiamine biosynthesis lipoprotein